MIVGCNRAVFRRPWLHGPAGSKLGSHSVRLNSTKIRLGVTTMRVAQRLTLHWELQSRHSHRAIGICANAAEVKFEAFDVQSLAG